MTNKSSLIFFPGLGFHASIWQPIADHFTNDDARLYDLPMTPLPESWSALTDQMNQTLPDEAILIAWSLGGIIAASLCHQFPKKYKKLILVATTPQFSDETIGIQPALIQQFKKEAIHDFPNLLKKLKILAAYPNRQIHFYKKLNTPLFKQEHQTTFLFYLNLLMQIDIRDCYAHLFLPTLQIFGEQDAILPLASAKHLAEKYPNFSTHIIKGASHIPFLSHPQEFLNCIIFFIKNEHHTHSAVNQAVCFSGKTAPAIEKHIPVFYGLQNKQPDQLLGIPIKNKKNIQRSFNKAVNTYDEYCHLQKKTGEKLLHLLSTHHNKKQKLRLIDLGCGTGIITEKLKSLFQDQELHAIDIADQLLLIAKKRLANEKNKKIKIYEADFDHLPHACLFDIAFSNMALHWSMDLKKTLENINTFLTQKGVLAFSIPLSGTLPELNNDFARQALPDSGWIETLLTDGGYDIFTHQVEKIILPFHDTESALKTIKNSGANYVPHRKNKNLKGKSWIHSFKLEQLTYVIGYYLAIKK